jgi:hypothetical protein
LGLRITKRGLKSDEVVNSQPVQNNISTDIQDLLKTTTNLKDTANIFEKLEQDLTLENITTGTREYTR